MPTVTHPSTNRAWRWLTSSSDQRRYQPSQTGTTLQLNYSISGMLIMTYMPSADILCRHPPTAVITTFDLRNLKLPQLSYFCPGKHLHQFSFFCTFQFSSQEPEQTKYALKATKNFIKFHLSGYVAINGQSITRFDCFVAVRLLNRPNIQEYWWIQEATGEVWIGLKQNVIDAAINEWRKCLRAVPMFVGQHFKHFCRQLKMDD